jgi:ADP-ribose pyrophosphatase YjhB (NUDIX family)
VTREYPSQPVVGVAAVVLRGVEVLLVRRGREPARGTWGLPGGVLELGETLAHGAQREVREECAVEIQVGPVVGVFEPMQRDPDGRLRFHYVVIDLLARHLAGEPRADDDAEEARWIALDQIDSLPMQDETRTIIRRAAAMEPGWPGPPPETHT